MTRLPADLEYDRGDPLEVYEPLTRGNSALGCLVYGMAFLVLLTFGVTFNNTWAILFIGPLLLVCFWLTFQSLAGSLRLRRPPTLKIFEGGIAIGEQFFGYSEIDHVDFRAEYLESDEGPPPPPTYRWNFHRANGTFEDFNQTQGANQYVPIERLNAPLRSRGLLRIHE